MSKVGESILRGAREALAYARGEKVPGMVEHRVPVAPREVDVKAIREARGMSQARFAATYGFSLDSIRNWEQGRRKPDVAARVLLTVIAREPEAVERALYA
jgi:putative transcriptional regulator